MNKNKKTGEGLPRSILCDDCGKTMLYITGVLNIELHNIISNNTRFVDNTDILCQKCLEKRLKRSVTK